MRFFVIFAFILFLCKWVLKKKSSLIIGVLLGGIVLLIFMQKINTFNLTKFGGGSSIIGMLAIGITVVFIGIFLKYLTCSLDIDLPKTSKNKNYPSDKSNPNDRHKSKKDDKTKSTKYNSNDKKGGGIKSSSSF